MAHSSKYDLDKIWNYLIENKNHIRDFLEIAFDFVPYGNTVLKGYILSLDFLSNSTDKKIEESQIAFVSFFQELRQTDLWKNWPQLSKDEKQIKLRELLQNSATLEQELENFLNKFHQTLISTRQVLNIWKDEYFFEKDEYLFESEPDLLDTFGNVFLYQATNLNNGEIVRIKIFKNITPKMLAIFQANYKDFFLLTPQELKENYIIPYRTIKIDFDKAYYNFRTQELFLISEYHEHGKNLRTLLQEKNHQFSLKDLEKYLLPIAQAIDFLHQKGIYQFNLTPENIWIFQEKDDDVKVMFDAVSLHYPKVTRSIAVARELLDDFFYMAPEQFLTQEEITNKKNIWAFGVIIYELLNKTSPFYGANSLVSLIKLISQTEPAPLKQIPSTSWEKLNQLFNKNPQERPESAVEALQNIIKKAHPIQKLSLPSKLSNISKKISKNSKINIEQIPKLDKSNKNLLWLVLSGLFVVVILTFWIISPKIKKAQLDLRKMPQEILILKGKFFMGSSPKELGHQKDEVYHKVNITYNFYIGKYEITQGKFRQLMGYNPSFFKNCGANCPVENVTWHEALAFCNALSKRKHLPQCFQCSGNKKDVRCRIKQQYAGPRYHLCKGFRLPTEAEWEYAYRSGTTTAYYNGNIENLEGEDLVLSDIAWYEANSKNKIHPIGKKLPNRKKIFDMAGNVWEWIFDAWKKQLPSHEVVNPIQYSGKNRVLRGGSWNSYPFSCRAAYRNNDSPFIRLPNRGFRIARSQ